MAACRELTREFQSRPFSKCCGHFFRNYILFPRPYPAPLGSRKSWIAPIDDSDMARLPDDAARLAQDGRFVGNLEEEIRDEDDVHRITRELRGARLFEVGPYYLDILHPALFGFIRNAPQKVALHLDCVDLAGGAQALGNGERVGAASRTEIGDFHAALDSKDIYITARVRKTYRVERTLRLHSAHYIVLNDGAECSYLFMWK